jgi:hypothetical protein
MLAITSKRKVADWKDGWFRMHSEQCCRGTKGLTRRLQVSSLYNMRPSIHLAVRTERALKRNPTVGVSR